MSKKPPSDIPVVVPKDIALLVWNYLLKGSFRRTAEEFRKECAFHLDGIGEEQIRPLSDILRSYAELKFAEDARRNTAALWRLNNLPETKLNQLWLLLDDYAAQRGELLGDSARPAETAATTTTESPRKRKSTHPRKRLAQAQPEPIQTDVLTEPEPAPVPAGAQVTVEFANLLAEYINASSTGESADTKPADPLDVDQIISSLSYDANFQTLLNADPYLQVVLKQSAELTEDGKREREDDM